MLAPLPVLVSADCARCGGTVLFWLRTFLFQPVACQQVVGFCLAIWVHTGVIIVIMVFVAAVIVTAVLCCCKVAIMKHERFLL